MIQQIQTASQTVYKFLEEVQRAHNEEFTLRGDWLLNLEYTFRRLIKEVFQADKILHGPWTGSNLTQPFFDGKSKKEAGFLTMGLIHTSLPALQEFMESSGVNVGIATPLSKRQLEQAWQLIDHFDQTVDSIVAFRMMGV